MPIAFSKPTAKEKMLVFADLSNGNYCYFVFVVNVDILHVNKQWSFGTNRKYLPHLW